MRKAYFEPEIEVRKYSLITDEVQTFELSKPGTDKDLHDDDEYDYFG